jgi:hypothetical protein
MVRSSEGRFPVEPISMWGSVATSSAERVFGGDARQ